MMLWSYPKYIGEKRNNAQGKLSIYHSNNTPRSVVTTCEGRACPLALKGNFNGIKIQLTIFIWLNVVLEAESGNTISNIKLYIKYISTVRLFSLNILCYSGS